MKRINLALLLDVICFILLGIVVGALLMACAFAFTAGFRQ